MKSLKLFLFMLYFAVATAAAAGTIDGAIVYRPQTVNDTTMYFNSAEACAAAAHFSSLYIGPQFYWHSDYGWGCMYDTVITPWYTLNNWFAQNWVLPVATCPSGTRLVDYSLGQHPFAKCEVIE